MSRLSLTRFAVSIGGVRILGVATAQPSSIVGILCSEQFVYIEPVCPPFWWLNPPKHGLFQSKQGPFRFQVNIYIYIYVCLGIEQGSLIRRLAEMVFP